MMSQLPRCLSGRNVLHSPPHTCTELWRTVRFEPHKQTRISFSCLLPFLFNFFLFFVHRTFIICSGYSSAAILQAAHFQLVQSPVFFSAGQLSSPVNPLALRSSIPLVMSQSSSLFFVCMRIRVVVVVHFSPLSTRVSDVFLYAYRPNSSLSPTRCGIGIGSRLTDGLSVFFSLHFFSFFFYSVCICFSTYRIMLGRG